jgi:glycosyltransferase involved in cell wall biosynthesis
MIEGRNPVSMQSKQPLVSIIMNCFNGEKYLRDAVESVLAQTYSNWEIIFWDNQSIDHSAEIVKNYDDPRVKYFYAPSHTILYEARNYAIEQSCGELLAFLDVDDWWLPEKLKCQVPCFNDPEVGFSCSNYWVRDERRETESVYRRGALPQGWVLDELMYDYSVAMSTLVVRRSAIESLPSKFDPTYQIIGDFDLVIHLATSWKLASIQDCLAFYRWHGANISGKREDLTVIDMNRWLCKVQQDKQISGSPGFNSVRILNHYRDAMQHLLRGDRFGAFKGFRELPLGKLKFKLLFAFLFPRALLIRRKVF